MKNKLQVRSTLYAMHQRVCLPSACNSACFCVCGFLLQCNGERKPHHHTQKKTWNMFPQGNNWLQFTAAKSPDGAETRRSRVILPRNLPCVWQGKKRAMRKIAPLNHKANPGQLRCCVFGLGDTHSVPLQKIVRLMACGELCLLGTTGKSRRCSLT